MRAVPTCQQAKYNKPYKLKNTVIPPDMCLIVDTREQHSPLFLDKPPKGLMVMRDTLKDGDYGLKGISNFAIEKKYHGDLFPYCSSEQRLKTKPKMERFKKMIDDGGWVGLVIEDTMANIFKWQQYCDVTPESVRGALTAFSINYHVHVHFAGNRENTARWILDHAVRYYNMVHEV